VEITGKSFIKSLVGESPGVDFRLEPQHLLSKQGRYLCVGNDAFCRIEISGIAIRARSLRIDAMSTGSRSKAMLWATSKGIASQRRRSFSSAGRRRHSVTRSVHFILHLLAVRPCSRNIGMTARKISCQTLLVAPPFFARHTPLFFAAERISSARAAK
jgi:hypothetical protein